VTTERHIEELLKLSEADRAEVVAALLASLDGEIVTKTEDDRLNEIERRLERIQANEAELISIRDAFGRMSWIGSRSLSSSPSKTRRRASSLSSRSAASSERPDRGCCRSDRAKT